MVGWHSKELGDGVEAFDPTTEIQESFLTLVQTQAQTGHYPFDAAVFSRHDLETNVVTVYFTPSVELLAMECGATPCEKPEAAGDFALIVGDERAWEAHFPGYLEQHRSGRR